MNIDILKLILKKNEEYYKKNIELNNQTQLIQKSYSQQLILFQELQILKLQMNLNANPNNYIFNFINII